MVIEYNPCVLLCLIDNKQPALAAARLIIGFSFSKYYNAFSITNTPRLSLYSSKSYEDIACNA